MVTIQTSLIDRSAIYGNMIRGFVTTHTETVPVLMGIYYSTSTHIISSPRVNFSFAKVAMVS